MTGTVTLTETATPTPVPNAAAEADYWIWIWIGIGVGVGLLVLTAGLCLVARTKRTRKAEAESVLQLIDASAVINPLEPDDGGRPSTILTHMRQSILELPPATDKGKGKAVDALPPWTAEAQPVPRRKSVPSLSDLPPPLKTDNVVDVSVSSSASIAGSSFTSSSAGPSDRDAQATKAELRAALRAGHAAGPRSAVGLPGGDMTALVAEAFVEEFGGADAAHNGLRAVVVGIFDDQMNPVEVGRLPVSPKP